MLKEMLCVFKRVQVLGQITTAELGRYSQHHRETVMFELCNHLHLISIT
jgi:hypothetical protein